MISREVIRQLLEAGCQAPSGSNSQPWKFEVRGNEIRVIALPEKDHPILNFRNRGTWIAHGALLENIVIAARKFGIDIEVKTFPDEKNSNVTAQLVLQESSPQHEPLYEAIFKRVTNRKPYKREPFSLDIKSKLMAAGKSIVSEAEIKFIDNPSALKLLGEAVSVNEIVMFENQALHELVFQEIVWNKEEEHKRGMGLYVKTMELKPSQKVALKLFKNWGVMRVFNKLGAARGIAKGNAKIYASTGLMGVVVIPDRDKDFLTAGRIMERIWLTATNLGLSFHLITGIFFMQMRIAAHKENIFSKEHKELIEDAYRKVATSFDITNGVIALLFRIGESEEPSGRSIKKIPEIIYIT